MSALVHPWCNRYSLVIINVMLFSVLFRYSSVELCEEHCVMLCHLLRSSSISDLPALGRLLSLLKRLAKFLPHHIQVKLRQTERFLCILKY